MPYYCVKCGILTIRLQVLCAECKRRYPGVVERALKEIEVENGCQGLLVYDDKSSSISWREGHSLAAGESAT